MVERFFIIHNLENFLTDSQLFVGNAMQVFMIGFKFGKTTMKYLLYMN
jgi:hypothetical protein